MATPPPVTDTLARFVTDTDYSSISETTRTNARMHILDTLGVALAGSKTAVADIAVDYCKKLGASSEASIWGTKAKASVSTAAFANGLLSHALDYDDWDAFIHVGHPSSMLVGASLSLAEHLGASGKELLKAYVLAMEVICKLAAHSPNMQDRGFHSTPVFGSLGAAVACGSLLKLDAAKLKAAIGVAASAAGGIHRQQGSMVKPFHAGNSARNGAEAALLASNGFTADAAIFEAPRGFCDTFFGKDTCDYDKMIQNLGQPYYLETPGMGLKWHPCSAPQFLAADAALHLKHEHKINFADVAKVEVSIPPLRYQRHYAAEVKTGLRASSPSTLSSPWVFSTANWRSRRLPMITSINRESKTRLTGQSHRRRIDPRARPVLSRQRRAQRRHPPQLHGQNRQRRPAQSYDGGRKSWGNFAVMHSRRFQRNRRKR
jgi:2-methylcitrate dehydratase PrpD